MLLRGAVVAWESMVLDDDGDAAFAVNYAVTENMSMAASVGALRLALAQNRARLHRFHVERLMDALLARLPSSETPI